MARGVPLLSYYYFIRNTIILGFLISIVTILVFTCCDYTTTLYLYFLIVPIGEAGLRLRFPSIYFYILSRTFLVFKTSGRASSTKYHSCDELVGFTNINISPSSSSHHQPALPSQRTSHYSSSTVLITSHHIPKPTYLPTYHPR